MCFRNLSSRPTQPGPFSGTQNFETGPKTRVNVSRDNFRSFYARFWTSCKGLSPCERSWLCRPQREVSKTHAEIYSSSFKSKVRGNSPKNPKASLAHQCDKPLLFEMSATRMRRLCKPLFWDEQYNSACLKVLTWGLNPNEDQTAEMVIINSSFNKKGLIFPITTIFQVLSALIPTSDQGVVPPWGIEKHSITKSTGV